MNGSIQFRFVIFMLSWMIFHCNTAHSFVQGQGNGTSVTDIRQIAKDVLSGTATGTDQEKQKSILDLRHLAENILNGKDVKDSTRELKEKFIEQNPALLGGFFDTPEMIRMRYHFYLEELEHKKVKLNVTQKKLLVNILKFCGKNIKEYEKRLGIAHQRERGILMLKEEKIETVVLRNDHSLSRAAMKLWKGYMDRKIACRPKEHGALVYGGRKHIGFRLLRDTQELVQKTRLGRLTKEDLATVEGMLRLLRYDLEVIWLDDLAIQMTLQSITPPTEFDLLSDGNCQGILRPLELLRRKSIPSGGMTGLGQNSSKGEIAVRKNHNHSGDVLWGVPIMPSDKTPKVKKKKLSTDKPHSGGINWGRGDQLAEKELEEELKNGPYQWQKFIDKDRDLKSFQVKIDWLKNGPDTQRFDLAIRFTTKLLGDDAKFQWPEKLRQSAFQNLKKPKYKNPFEKLYSKQK